MKARVVCSRTCGGLTVGTLAVAGLMAWPGGLARAQVAGYLGFEEAFGYKSSQPPADYHVQFIGSSARGNIFRPGEQARFDFQLVNKTGRPLKAAGRWELIQYATRCQPTDPLAPPMVSKVRAVAQTPASVDLPAGGFINQSAQLPLPAEFGAYAVVLALEGHGRELAALCVRAVPTPVGRVRLPTYACDIHRPELMPLFRRLGVKGTRQELGYFSVDDKAQWDRLDANMKTLMENDITLMLTIATGSDYSRMPLGRIRGFLNDKDEGKMDYPGDFTMLPRYDDDFQKWVRTLLERYGWPKGPVNAVELWNEPWEGMSISGWGADLPRYRELYTRMARGVEEARQSAGVEVLIGGCCSSMNTEDKLFPDGKDEPFLKWLDFTSIHYQPMCPEPVLIRRFAQRKSPRGPTRVWDTESWLANSEDRVAGMIASMRATGLERTSGVFHGALREEQETEVRDAGGKTHRAYVAQALPTSAAVAAMEAYMGQRPFKELLFRNGLPWVFVFGGLANEDDGTVVVVGDLGAVYDRDLLLFRGVLGPDARRRGAALRAQLAALPPDAPEARRNDLLARVRAAEVLDNARMTLSDGGGHFVPLDWYGNPLRPEGGRIVVPLNGLGYFLRTDGSAGSFARLLDALRAARIDGYEPVDVVAHDLLARVESQPALRLTFTNILNRQVAGKLEVKLGGLELEEASRRLTLAPHETRTVSLQVTGGKPSADNSYPLTVVFNGGDDGRKVHEEVLHVNAIARRTITVDGRLDDWEGVLPQPARSGPGAGKNLTEKAWLPFVKLEDARGQGYGIGYLSHDDHYFYFAAKIADATPYEGNLRFANRDEDSYFYPEVAWDVRPDGSAAGGVRRTPLRWPAGVRRFSYRKNPDLPTGDGTDNVQIAFNALPVEQTDWLSHPAGTMPRFMVYKTTDYEYALNPVAPRYGGGAEVWRLLAPGVPRKHFYPRQPRVSPPGKDGGPVTKARLVMRREGNTRLVECAIPWSEIPDVKRKRDAGESVKFTFRVNDNQGRSYELNEGRSVSKADTYALHNYWQTSWAVETEFAFEK